MSNKYGEIISRVFFVIFCILSVFFIVLLGLFNIIPLKYMVLIGVILILINVGLFFLFIYKSNKIKKIIGYILSLILIISGSCLIYFLNTTMKFFKEADEITYKEENYLVLVNIDSKFTNLNELYTIGYKSNELSKIQLEIDKLEENLKLKTTKYDDEEKMFSDLKNNKINAILIEESVMDLFNGKYDDLVKVIDKINVKTEIQIDSDIDVTKKTFAIYLSGIDSYGRIANISRSDVNIVGVVNPLSKQVLLLSVPRDYYVQLRDTTGLKDKLTHAGVYGIETSVGTLEDLLKTDINYYLRVNFSSLIRIVDALGGVDVYSKYSFTSTPATGDTFYFQKGYNHMNGRQALSFARERKVVPGGDRTRGENQQAVIDGIIRKAASPAIINSYSKILNGLKGTFQTNMNEENIQKLIKMQLNDMASWNITSYSLNGSDSRNYTYSAPGQELYVMEPDIESVNEGIDLIDKVINGEVLKSSYDKEASNIKNPTHVDPPKPIINEKPIIEFKEETIKIKKGEKINLLKDVTATDKEDGKLTPKVNISDTSILVSGKHIIIYTVEDKNGNKVNKERTLIVLAEDIENKPEEKPEEKPDTPDKKPEDEDNKDPEVKPKPEKDPEQPNKNPEDDKKPDVQIKPDQN